ncbi:Acyl-CoA dehydrogenase [Salinihabitans flavidus]|uniref:Acyl-CoA dehydrogenase n=1 Tax=Salinihabitans flavidus TaxID=569882 RepID=A0A1H8TP07_9RHOB|nr:acyl-CoA dehydrogenase family protein [Salinihabitans flavidus]SEO92188.1 Acyl-CoA dehydrogenase [Salinihabitans flavidus]
MDLSCSPAEQAFQGQVRAFLRDNLPEDLAGKVRGNRPLSREDMDRWHRILSRQGWLGVTWPKAFGGPGWGAVERHIFEEECALACAPRIVPFGPNMLGPVLIKFGSPAQQEAYLPRILSCEDWWCQGYSEPGAGSDLASLKTKAVREGDHYVINGQKTWTTLGQYANRIFCLVRTSWEGKPQQGISFILVDLDTPGIEMRPIRLIEGGHEVNEVFFTDVRVPAENLVGEENMGWTIAKYLLLHERTNIAGIGFSMQAFEALKKLAQEVTRDGKPLSEAEWFATRLAQIETDLAALRITNLRMLSKADKTGAPGPESSMLKIKGTLIRQALTDLSRRALGPGAAALPGTLPDNLGLVPPEHEHDAAVYFNMRKISVYGGSNEIQRNILAKTLLEL